MSQETIISEAVMAFGEVGDWPNEISVVLLAMLSAGLTTLRLNEELAEKQMIGKQVRVRWISAGGMEFPEFTLLGEAEQNDS